ncbi:hypothetical protein LshimejAT787_1602200 [Lyophyllum shimeji]|uniref:Uncharacterized protein n=1 Tax=Lyophyllum shimeji TaxID=47721 RepID=A0A9P3UU28_LYOSH|nr:hypothetical protein LshimejAT787_1602200 [Lyophyllum shimeji]
MPSTTGHYDQNLLAAAPAATKAQLQEGYTTDLLNPDHGKATPPPSTPAPDLERGLVNKEYLSPARAPPFWRTRKGIIIIAVAAVVVLAAVIGGAVGGTRNKHKDSGDSGGLGESASTSPTSSSTAPDSAGPVAGSNPTATGTQPSTSTAPPVSTVEQGGPAQTTQSILFAGVLQTGTL